MASSDIDIDNVVNALLKEYGYGEPAPKDDAAVGAGTSAAPDPAGRGEPADAGVLARLAERKAAAERRKEVYCEVCGLVKVRSGTAGVPACERCYKRMSVLKEGKKEAIQFYSDPRNTRRASRRVKKYIQDTIDAARSRDLELRAEDIPPRPSPKPEPVPAPAPKEPAQTERRPEPQPSVEEILARVGDLLEEPAPAPAPAPAEPQRSRKHLAEAAPPRAESVPAAKASSRRRAKQPAPPAAPPAKRPAAPEPPQPEEHLTIDEILASTERLAPEPERPRAESAPAAEAPSPRAGKRFAPPSRRTERPTIEEVFSYTDAPSMEMSRLRGEGRPAQAASPRTAKRPAAIDGTPASAERPASGTERPRKGTVPPEKAPSRRGAKQPAPPAAPPAKRPAPPEPPQPEERPTIEEILASTDRPAEEMPFYTGAEPPYMDGAAMEDMPPYADGDSPAGDLSRRTERSMPGVAHTRTERHLAGNPYLRPDDRAARKASRPAFSLNRPCQACGADEWVGIDGAYSYIELCNNCEKRKVEFKKQDYVDNFECPYCGGLTGVREENKRKFGVRCSNCGELTICFTKVDELLMDEKLTAAITDYARSLVSDQVVCPRCGSESVTTGTRGISLGVGRTVNRCARCGYAWKPEWTVG